MAEKIILTEDEWCMCQLGSDRGGTYAEYLKEMKTCEYCGENAAAFRVEVRFPSNEVDKHDACPLCVATFFTETPEDVEFMQVLSLKSLGEV